MKEAVSALEQARKDAGLTRKEVYTILGVPKRTYEDWEWGNRIPKKGMDYYIKVVKALGILTSEARQCIIDGQWTLEDALDQYKIESARKLSKWGAYGGTFSACWNRIPAGVVEASSAEDLAALVDQIKEAYDQGKADKNLE